MSHPTIWERAEARRAQWENTQEEARELFAASNPQGIVFLNESEPIRDLIAAALWLVDHLYSTSECGVTMAREGDLEDVKAAVEALRKVAES